MDAREGDHIRHLKPYTLADPPPRDDVVWEKCFGGEVRIIGTHVVSNPTDVPEGDDGLD